MARSRTSIRGVIGRGLRLGRVLGIEVVIDLSLIVVFLLVLGSLAFGVIPGWHPGWSPWLVGAVSLAAAVLFFVSVLAHEMAHAITARLVGIEVRRITLFIFGGMAQMEDEARTPGSEFLIAIAGPAMSLIIGASCMVGGLVLAHTGLPAIAASGGDVMSASGPVATLLLWLGPVNMILAAFNMVPGFPLDGGRVLRALIWRITGSIHRATRIAAHAGQGFGWILMGVGVLMVLGIRIPFFGSGLSGLWLLLIGWFLGSAARRSYRQFFMLRLLESVPVREVMRTEMSTVYTDDTLEDVVRDRVMNSDQRSFPVVHRVDDRDLRGIVSLDAMLSVPRQRWPVTPISTIMIPYDDVLVMAPDEDAEAALRNLSRTPLEQIPVVSDSGVLQGIVRRQDIMKWMALRQSAGTG